MAKTDVCPCDPSRTTEALEIRLRQIEQALNKPTNFWLGTNIGQLLWNMLSGLLLLWVVNAACKLNEMVGFARALQRIQLYLYRRQKKAGGCTTDALATPSPEDVRQIAIVLSRLEEINSCANAGQPSQVAVQQEQLLDGQRSFLKRLLSSAPQEKSHTMQVHPTHCMPACAAPCKNSTDPDSSNQHDTCEVSIGVVLPDKTLAGEKAADFQRQSTRILPAQAQLSPLESGSTFLYATVAMVASASDFMVVLLSCACDLVRMASGFDPACTVQLGGVALLHMGPGGNVKRRLLKKGVHDIPIITSAQDFGAKTLVIKGLHLDEAQIIASMGHGKTASLTIFYHHKMESGLEMLIAQLPRWETFGEGTRIYARRTILIQGHTHPLIVRSPGLNVEICNESSCISGVLKKRRCWICLMASCVYQFRGFPLRSIPSWGAVSQLAIALMGCFLVERVLGPWTFDITTRFVEKTLRFVDLEYSSTGLIDGPSLNANRQESDNDEIDAAGEDDEEIDAVGLQVNDSNWEWPCFRRFRGASKWVTEREQVEKNDNMQEAYPFKVMKTFHGENSEPIVELIVSSDLLIKVLKQCQPRSEIHFEKDFSIDPCEIFWRRKSLRAFCDAYNSGHPTTIAGDRLLDGQPLTVWYTKHLLRFVDRHFAKELVMHERMNAEGCVSYAMLWTFLVPGDGVRRRCQITDEDCFAKVRHIEQDDDRSGKSWLVTLTVMDFNVKSYHKCTMSYKISAFEGEVPFTSLQLCPLQYLPTRKEMEARFVNVGNLFYQVAMQQPYRFMQFTGSINFFQQEGRCFNLRKLNADGRVMIDLLSFARMNPDYDPLRNAKPPCEVMTGMWKWESMKKPTDEELKMAPAFVYGFSIRLKKWGCFELCGLQDIKFNLDAFSTLSMRDADQKLLLQRVVESYTTAQCAGRSPAVQNEQSLDPIANKGSGCIILCHGPPGTGKTLTAEALAEKLERPLWAISAFELGEDARNVEETLSRLMDISHYWNAILLLDEADGYLQRRDEGVGVKRNLLTGVFLRLLEYYQGIMFLTTNRATAFDEAILSRTTLAICYPPLEAKQRLAVWNNLLARAGIRCETTTDFHDLSNLHNLNGRQIRNIVHLAQLLAWGGKERPHIKHVRTAMREFLAGCINEPSTPTTESPTD